jgi:hypothetical protein
MAGPASAGFLREAKMTRPRGIDIVIGTARGIEKLFKRMSTTARDCRKLKATCQSSESKRRIEAANRIGKKKRPAFLPAAGPSFYP